ncbi:hypothetical protein [uncultured Duncaniella sp.]|nr:hypothetical protein [uncultured Duncaniella sp.]
MPISSWVHGKLCADGERGRLRAKPMADYEGRFGGKDGLCHAMHRVLL